MCALWGAWRFYSRAGYEITDQLNELIKVLILNLSRFENWKVISREIGFFLISVEGVFRLTAPVWVKYPFTETTGAPAIPIYQFWTSRRSLAFPALVLEQIWIRITIVFAEIIILSLIQRRVALVKVVTNETVKVLVSPAKVRSLKQTNACARKEQCSPPRGHV